MKSKWNKVLIAVFSSACLFSLLLGVAACNEDGEQLSAPAGFKMEDEVLYWESVRGAEEYLVAIREELFLDEAGETSREETEEFYTDGTSFDVFELTYRPGNYFMSVTALASDYRFDSPPAEEIAFTVKTPALLARLDENTGGYAIRAASKTFKGKLVLPTGQNATTILEEGFRDCTGITSLYIPDNITVIGASAFQGCSNLRRVRLPRSEEFTAIPVYMFADCIRLYDAEIPENVSSIGGGAFGHCASLKEIYIPASVTLLDGLYQDYSLPYTGCTPERVTVAEENPAYYLDGNCIMTREGNVLTEGFSGSTIPACTQAIGVGAFQYVKGLKQLFIPESVKTIGLFAFAHTDLEELEIPGSFEMIDYGVLSMCKNLRRLKFGEGVQSMKYYAVPNAAIGSLELPSTLTEIDHTAFDGTDFNTVTVAEGNPVYYSEGNCIMQRDGAFRIVDDGQYVVQRKGLLLFKGGSDSVIPEGTLAIGDHAFFWNDNLKEINIPASVKSIGGAAFAGCKRLKHVRLPEGLEELAENAFGSCSSVEGIVVPESLRYIGNGAFGGDHMTCFATGSFDELLGTTALPKGDTAKFFGCTFGYDGDYPYLVSAKGKDAIFGGGDSGSALFTSIIGAPYRKGYTFAGWAIEEGGDVVYEAYTQKGSVPLLPVWVDAGSQEIPYIEVSWQLTNFGADWNDRDAWREFYQAFQDVTLYAVWIPE